MRTKARHYYPPIKKCRGSTLKPWENGLQAKCAKKEGGKQMVFCTVLNVNNDDKTCSVDFSASVVRHDVTLSDACCEGECYCFPNPLVL